VDIDDFIDNLTSQELAILYATRISPNCQSLKELAQNVEVPIDAVDAVKETLDHLVEKRVLAEVRHFDGIRYGFDLYSTEADYTYAYIYEVEPLGF